MNGYHEPYEALPEEARDAHRALASLKEEIEAVDWYHQRVVLAKDEELKAVLAHNRDEEVEHACMALEWLRRAMPAWDAAMKRYLFIEGSIAGRERAAHGDDAHGAGGDLGLRDLIEEK
jgi:ferritin-like protein